MRSTPSARRQSDSGSGSGPVSISATSIAERTSTASPCPTSHVAIDHPSGVATVASGPFNSRWAPASERTTTRIPAAPPLSSRSLRTVAVPDVAFRARITTIAIDTLTTATSAALPMPAGRRICAPGTRAVVVAVAAIQAEGSQAHAVSRSANGGTGAARHARSPITVATGAAGSAIRFAAIPISDCCSANSAMMGPQVSCAASGTARASATGAGMNLPMPRASGGASRMSAPEAATDSAKPGVAASHGSARTMPTAHSASIPAPALGRPSSTVSMAAAAITAARITLGSGVTSTTNPASPASASTTRRVRPPPHRAVSEKTAPTTMAQLAPLTAVRWLRPLARISSFSAADTARVSPTARPGSRPAPGSGRRCDLSENTCLIVAATPNTPDAGATIAASLAKTTRADRSPASVADASPTTRTRAPRSKPSAGSTPIRIGAPDTEALLSGEPIPVA